MIHRVQNLVAPAWCTSNSSSASKVPTSSGGRSVDLNQQGTVSLYPPASDMNGTSWSTNTAGEARTTRMNETRHEDKSKQKSPDRRNSSPAGIAAFLRSTWGIVIIVIVVVLLATCCTWTFWRKCCSKDRSRPQRRHRRRRYDSFFSDEVSDDEESIGGHDSKRARSADRQHMKQTMKKDERGSADSRQHMKQSSRKDERGTRRADPGVHAPLDVPVSRSTGTEGTLVGAKHVFKNSLYSENPFSTGSPAERSIVIGDNIDLDPSMSGHATRAWSQN